MYALLYLVVSIPAGILLPAAYGIVTGVTDAVERREHPETILFIASLAMPVVVAALPGVPRYDGSRLFLNAFPFVACLAGIGFSRGIAPLARRVLPAAPRAAAAVAAWLFLAPTALSLWSVHPFEPYSYYNVLTRGPSGAIGLGLSPVVWAMSDRTVVEYLNEHALPGETVYDATGATAPLKGYQELGLLQPGLRWGHDADWMVLEYNLAYAVLARLVALLPGRPSVVSQGIRGEGGGCPRSGRFSRPPEHVEGSLGHRAAHDGEAARGARGMGRAGRWADEAVEAMPPPATTTLTLTAGDGGSISW